MDGASSTNSSNSSNNSNISNSINVNSNKKINTNLKTSISGIVDSNTRSKPTAVANDAQAINKNPNWQFNRAKSSKRRNGAKSAKYNETTTIDSGVQTIISTVGSGSGSAIGSGTGIGIGTGIGTDNGTDIGTGACTSTSTSTGLIGNQIVLNCSSPTAASVIFGKHFGKTDGKSNAASSKKQNLNHLLNFRYAPREVEHNSGGCGGSGGLGKRNLNMKLPKFNKEQFLQANCQFVIKSSAKRKAYKSPDVLIDWSLIEQINIRTSDMMQCPICLYPPRAAKMTRCGHIYCWPCILHYLSLTDKNWSKCPICFEAIHAADLKSSAIIQQQMLDMGSLITFHLMRRKKGSLYVEKHNRMLPQSVVVKCPFVSSSEEDKCFAKFLLAKRIDVANILAREERELLAALKETSAEYLYIQQALEMLQKRKLSESHDDNGKVNDNEAIAVNKSIEENISSDLDEKQENNIDVIASAPDAVENNLNDDDTVGAAGSTAADDDDDDDDDEDDDGTVDTKTIENDNVNDNDDNENDNDNDNDNIGDYDDDNDSENMKNKSAIKYYYFYQCVDGQHVYLHPINVKMLLACYGSLAKAPTEINARIVQKEQYSMNVERRRKYRCLNHLPLTCEITIVEVELLPPYVTDDIIRSFKEELAFRKKVRKRRARAELEREKKISAINDQQMGKLIASTVNINLNSDHEFPTFVVVESLPASNSSVTPEPAVQEDQQDASVLAVAAVTSLNTPIPKQRTKTLSGSSSVSSNCTYSAVASNCLKEATPWVTINACELERKRLLAADAKSKYVALDETVVNNMQTNLGDVITAALSKTVTKVTTKASNNKTTVNATATATATADKTKSTAADKLMNTTTKKGKKSKRMQLIYSTGIHVSGN